MKTFILWLIRLCSITLVSKVQCNHNITRCLLDSRVYTEAVKSGGTKIKGTISKAFNKVFDFVLVVHTYICCIVYGMVAVTSCHFGKAKLSL